MQLFFLIVSMTLIIYTAGNEKDTDVVYEYVDEWADETTIDPDSTDPPGTDPPGTDPPGGTDPPPDVTTQPPSGTDTPTPPPPTTPPPPDPDHSSVLLKGITLQDFINNNTESDFKNSVARYMTLHCGTTSCIDSIRQIHLQGKEYYLIPKHHPNAHMLKYISARLHFKSAYPGTFNLDVSADNVTVVNPREVSGGVQLEFYISLEDPSSGAEIQLDRDIVDGMLEEYSQQISQEIGVEVEVIPAPGPNPTPTGPPDSGLEDWEIALIVIGSVLGAGLIVAAIVLAVKKTGKKSESNYDYIDVAQARYGATSTPGGEGDKLTDNRQSARDSTYGGTSTFMYDNPSFKVDDDDKGEMQENRKSATDNLYSDEPKRSSTYQESFTQL